MAQHLGADPIHRDREDHRADVICRNAGTRVMFPMHTLRVSDRHRRRPGPFEAKTMRGAVRLAIVSNGDSANARQLCHSTRIVLLRHID